MSDYPPAPPYGASYGGQSQTNTSYLPPYQNQYMQQDDGRAAQTHMASNYDTSLSAYGYNNAIPGFIAGSLAAAAPPLPLYQGWNQDAIPLPSFPTPQSNIPYTGYGGNAYQPAHSYSAPQPQTYQQNTHHNVSYDEGELSDGEFDTYAGQNAGTVASTIHGSGYYQGNDGTGYVNTAHRAVYPSGQDYKNQQYAPGSEYNNHRESASYSPYAPTAPEASQDERPKRKRSYNAYVSGPATEQSFSDTPHAYSINDPVSHVQSLKVVERKSTPAQSLSAKPALPKRPVTPKTIAEPRSATLQTSTQDVPSLPPGFQSVAEARKKAEAAVLNVWPYDIRFSVYIEEGFDEKIVGGLFDGLGLSRGAKATVPVSEEKPSIDGVNGTSSQAKIARSSGRENVAPGTKEDAASISATLYESSSHLDTAKELEVLVEQKGNGIAPSTAASIQSKSSEPTEKEKNLKMKMEMLRKSREERAQKVAAKTTTTDATAPQPEPSKFPISSAAPSTNSLISSSLPPLQNATPQQLSSTQPVPLPQSTVTLPPIIPGLFLASTSSPAQSTAAQGAMNGTSQTTQRKRLVAADFDTPASTIPFKRPFGQSCNDSLVIDVSEDEDESEDEDVAMDLESQADQDSPIHSARKMSDQRAVMIQNLPPLTNFSTRKAFASPPDSSAASTPPVSKSILGHPQVLQQKESEIEVLKKKIAAAEAAKAAKKKAHMTSSGAATPQHQAVNGATVANTTNGDLASKVEASIQMQQLIGIAEDTITSDQKKLAETQAAESEKAAEVKRNEAESRRLRRQTIATDLPRVDAEVEQSQLKLQQLREEMARVEAAVQKSMEDKRRLAEEMERLGQEAEEQLQEQKEKLKNLTNSEVGSVTGSPRGLSLPTGEAHDEQLALPQKLTPSNLAPSEAASQSATFSQAAVSPPVETEIADTNSVPIGSSPIKSSSSEAQPVESSSLVTADQAMEAALQETIRADAESHEEGEAEMDIGIEDSYAPDPAQLAPESPAHGIDPSTASDAEVHNSSLDNEVALPDAQLTSAIDNEVEYEPPGATSPANSPMESPPFSPAPPESVADLEEFAYDIPAFGHRVASIVEDESEQQVNGSVPHLIENHKESSNQIQFFTPYESPLKAFRAFRFHPNFKQQVSGGLRSTTYSHKMDPTTEFCRFELAAGVCNDKSCEFQHFKDIALADDTILSTLGSPEEFPADQQQKFREGLREVLTGLRARKVRDFDTIAAEVVAHRSKFLGDPSKVLMLEGTHV